jgi:hypothetical protein
MSNLIVIKNSFIVSSRAVNDTKHASYEDSASIFDHSIVVSDFTAFDSSIAVLDFIAFDSSTFFVDHAFSLTS